MKLLLFVLAVCAVGRSNIQSTQLMNFEYYWRDWDVNTSIPEDAVATGVVENGHPTYFARSVDAKYRVKVPGRARPHTKNMWFQSQLLENTTTKDIEILCVLNERRLKWVATKHGVTVDSVVGDNVLILGGTYSYHYTTIGRRIIGNEIQIGKLNIYGGRFAALTLCQNGQCFLERGSYEVLLYVKYESVDI